MMMFRVFALTLCFFSFMVSANAAENRVLETVEETAPSLDAGRNGDGGAAKAEEADTAIKPEKEIPASGTDKNVEVKPDKGDETKKTKRDIAYSPLYKALKERLAEVELEIANRNPADHTPVMKFPDKLVKEGYVHPDIAILRKKLDSYFTYDVMNANPEYFDAQLAGALREFQTQMGLASDGVLGPETLELLNRSPEQEKQQILVNMDRLRQPEWLGRPDVRIEVDIARYWLTAYEDNKVIFEMPVVVGSQERQTNRFSTMMNGVRLNPGWTLPPTIKSEDYIPKLRQDPEWVTQQGVLIYDSWDKDAEPIDPTTIDWSFLNDNAIKAMRFYKLAGDNNPLGRYRFLMPSANDIYLHDTNQKYLFKKSDRAYSSGCVRVFDPRKIAEFLLKGTPGWNSERIDEVLETTETYNVRATRPIPVYFDYKTAWLDEKGALVLGSDIYGLDAQVDYGKIASGKGNVLSKIKSGD